MLPDRIPTAVGDIPSKEYGYKGSRPVPAGPAVGALALLVCLFFSNFLSAGEPFPLDLGIEVRLGEGMAMESIREELELSLLDDPGLRACYRSVSPFSGGLGVVDPDLVLMVTILDVDEEIRHEQTMARYAQSSDPDDALRVLVILRFEAIFELIVPGAEHPLRFARIDKRVTERPDFSGQDSRFDARMRILDDSVRRGRSMACKCSRKKLERALSDNLPPR